MEGFVQRRDLVGTERLKALSRRSDLKGLARLASHGAAIALGMGAVAAAAGTWWLVAAVPALGLALIFLFCPLHESTHRTPFRSRWLNDAVGWVAGAVLVLPPHEFRQFHMAHHRWTQDPARDPELAVPPVATRAAYLFYVTGWGYWKSVTTGLVRRARGRVIEPYTVAAERPAVIAEARAYVLLYLGVAAIGLGFGTWAPVLYWLFPVVVAQPALRLYLLAEHTGCPFIPDMMANTRTLATNPFVRWLAWNMPYHAEHHAFPGVPFHALPALNADLAGRHKVLSPGYADFHRRLWASLGHAPAVQRAAS